MHRHRVEWADRPNSRSGGPTVLTGARAVLRPTPVSSRHGVTEEVSSRGWPHGWDERYERTPGHPTWFGHGGRRAEALSYVVHLNEQPHPTNGARTAFRGPA